MGDTFGSEEALFFQCSMGTEPPKPLTSRAASPTVSCSQHSTLLCRGWFYRRAGRDGVALGLLGPEPRRQPLSSLISLHFWCHSPLGSADNSQGSL
jgi:hypothetical protein